MIRAAQYVIRRLPFLLIALKAFWVVLFHFGFHAGEYWFVSEIQAHSLAFCAVLAYYAYIGRHCLYLWICIFGLAALNLLNILYYFRIIDNYLGLYTWAVFLTCFLFAALHALQRFTQPSKRAGFSDL